MPLRSLQPPTRSCERVAASGRRIHLSLDPRTERSGGHPQQCPDGRYLRGAGRRHPHGPDLRSWSWTSSWRLARLGPQRAVLSRVSRKVGLRASRKKASCRTPRSVPAWPELVSRGCSHHQRSGRSAPGENPPCPLEHRHPRSARRRAASAPCRWLAGGAQSRRKLPIGAAERELQRHVGGLLAALKAG